MKKAVSKISKILFVLTMIFSMSFAQISNIEAWDNTVPHEFTKVKKIKYPEWWGNKVPGLSSWSTYSTKYNGKWAYCLESSKKTPGNGNYAADVIENNEAVRKLMYYGFGGPGDVLKTWGQGDPNAQGKIGYDYLKLSICPNDSYLTSEDVAYLLTHIFLSGAYSGDWNGFSEAGFNAAFGGNYGTNIMNIYRNIINLPDIVEPKFSPSEQDGIISSFSAFYDKGTKQQITNTVTFEGNSSSTVNIPLADNVTIYINGNAVQTGGAATVHGGESFYFTAPAKNSPDDMPLTNVTGSGCERFTALAIKTGTDSAQQQGSWTWDPDNSRLYTKIDWMDFGELELVKTNDVGDLIDGAVFNLKSSSYDGYEENITVTNGKIKVEDLPVGEYILTETKVPGGHAITQKIFKVTINKDEVTQRVVVNKIRPTGNLKINKALENSENENAVNKADYDFSKVQFKITADHDIYDSVSLEKLYSKGDAVTTGSGKGSNDDTVKLLTGTELENGIYTPDKDGKLELSGLPMGTYAVEEVNSPEGFVLDGGAKKVQFQQTDFVTLTYFNELNINNELTKTVFSKVTADGDNLYGVPMEIVDAKTGEQVYNWITDDNDLEIDGLPTGDYIWREVNAPEGYVLAKPIEFTVKDGDIQDIEMKNFSVEFAKNGNDGNKLLKGGEFQVTSTKTKQIVDKWTSGEHVFDVTEDMKAKLMAGETVSDMFINIEDDSSTYYRISKNADRDDYRLLMQANGETKYYNIDINGDETTHMIRGTVEDQEYVITELKSPDGYATAEPVTFKTNKEQNLTVAMTDEITQFEFYKKDITSQEELEGATLQIKDKNGNIVDEWVSEKTPHKITGLTVGQTYTMIEVIAPVNYKIAQNKEFTVSDTGEVQKITMYDELMPVAKKVKTGDSSNPFSYLVLTGVAVLGMSLVYYRKRKSC
jgi:uncharacterized surface anchored protein